MAAAAAPLQARLRSNLVLAGRHKIAMCEWVADQCNHNGDPRTASLDALFRHARGAGYDGVEFSYKLFAKYFRNMSPEQVCAAAKRKAEEYGLEIVGANVWWCYDFPGQDWSAELEGMRAQARYVKAMGGRYVTFQMWITPECQGTAGAYRNDDAYLDKCARRIEDLHDVCWDLGLNCYIETHVQRISEDPEAFVKIMDKCAIPFETNGDLSHYIYRNFRNDTAWMKKILGRMGHTHQRMCRNYGDLSVNVPDPHGDWSARGVTWTAFQWSRPGLEGGLSSRVICGESGPMHQVSDPLTVDASLVPLYRMMAAFADASSEGKSVAVDAPDDWDPWRRAAAV
jgi:sugar phosphate isomerase/epimerase